MPAGRPPNDVEAYDERITVRLHAYEKRQLMEEADFAGLSMGELVRRRYFGRKIVAKADLGMVKELRRVAGSLRDIHNTSKGAYSDDTARALRALTAFIEKLAEK